MLSVIASLLLTWNTYIVVSSRVGNCIVGPAPSCDTEFCHPGSSIWSASIPDTNVSNGIVWTMNGTTIGEGKSIDMTYCAWGCLEACSSEGCASVYIDCDYTATPKPKNVVN